MSSSTLSTIQSQLILYGYSTLMILGSVGNAFIIILFIRQRPSACTIYLRTSAAINIVYLIHSCLSRTLPSYYGNGTIGALVMCKINYYIPAALGQVHKTMLILASVDRFLITSDRARFRAISTPKQAKYLIFFSFIFWSLLMSHILVIETIVNGQCVIASDYSTFFSIFTILCIGLIPPILASTFGYLTYRNMKHRHIRVQPNEPNAIDGDRSVQRRNQDLFIIVISEIMVYVVTVAPFPIILLESMISRYVIPNKSSSYLEIERFATILALIVLTANSASAFYVYFITSKTFRRDFKQLIINVYEKLRRQPIIPTASNAITRTVPQQKSRV